MKMRDFSIGVRIGGGFGLLVCVVTVMAVLGWIGVATVQDNMRTLYVDYTVAAIDLAHVRADLGSYRSLMIETVQAPNKNVYDTTAARFGPIQDRIDKTIADYSATILRVSKSGRNEREDLKKFKVALEQYFKGEVGIRSTLADAFALSDPDMQRNMVNLAGTSIRTEGTQKFNTTAEKFDELLKTVGEVAKDLHEDGVSAAQSSKKVLLVGLLVSLLLAGGISFVIARGVVRPIKMVNIVAL